MSAVTTHLELDDPSDYTPGLRCESGDALSGELGMARSCIPALEHSHNNLLKMLWLRRTVEELLVGRDYWVADGASIGKPSIEANRLFFVIDPAMVKEAVPWSFAANEIIASPNALPIFV